MMSLVFFRILFFCLVPIGIVVLVKTIRMLKGVFRGVVVIEFPFTQKQVNFAISERGIYAVWHKGKLFRRTPIDKFKLRLVHVETAKEVRLSSSFLMPYLNDMDKGRIELLRFYATPGRYRIEVMEGSSASIFEKLFAKLFPFEQVDYNQYFIQVRKSKPVYYLIASIPLFTLCGICIIGGFVAGFAAPDILKGLGITYVS